ncbi:hypothetical protein H4R34_003740 [Dimargaris verticillata]|uniref:DASH complex subunit DUO1 n=1 Tax=Dimargaris verticillata TaxID=2761393 RepID=A0A9W8ECC0_9FUNG|nr:hypothetical protein H4R34_003740 [Dimargaris verticillata]
MLPPEASQDLESPAPSDGTPVESIFDITPTKTLLSDLHSQQPLASPWASAVSLAAHPDQDSLKDSYHAEPHLACDNGDKVRSVADATAHSPYAASFTHYDSDCDVDGSGNELRSPQQPPLDTDVIDAAPAKDEALAQEWESLRKINVVMEAVSASLETVHSNVATFHHTVQQTKELLGVWSNMLAGTHRIQALMMNPQWRGANHDQMALEEQRLEQERRQRLAEEEAERAHQAAEQARMDAELRAKRQTTAVDFRGRRGRGGTTRGHLGQTGIRRPTMTTRRPIRR